MNEYVIRQIRLWRALRIEKPGMFHTYISHDDWCEVLKGMAECNCSPDITIKDEIGNVLAFEKG
jgi:hypothetical protein